MSNNTKPTTLAAALIGGLVLSSSAFAMTELSSGYMLGTSHSEKAVGKHHSFEAMDTDKDGSISEAEFAAAHDGDATRFAKYDTDKDGSISADEMKAAHEGKCGEGKCGGDKKAKGDMEGKCGEGKCGEGKCGADKKVKAGMEGKCGEGKCGGSA